MNAAQVQEAVKSAKRLRVRGGGSKTALSQGAEFTLTDLSGVLEYNPNEYTFTALSGTKLSEVNDLLAAEGQYLPFDPPFADAGATLGGTVAAGLSGPGRFRYGGVRDFLLGITFVDGSGELLSGGGKVVKNAAGFDLPKLMVGSLGRFGVLVELTFKVFPHPESYATLELTTQDFTQADRLIQQLALSGFEAVALELMPPNCLLARFGGRSEALPKRLNRVQAFLGREGDVLTGDAEVELWREANAFSWVPAGHALVKVVHSPRQVTALEATLSPFNVLHRYGVGGNVCYLAWPEAERVGLEALLQRQTLSGLALTGSWTQPHLGRQTGNAFLERIEKVFDPRGIFTVTAAHTTDAEVSSAA